MEENGIYTINVPMEKNWNERRKATGLTWRQTIEKGVEQAEHEKRIIEKEKESTPT